MRSCFFFKTRIKIIAFPIAIGIATELFFEEDSSVANRRSNWRKRTSRLDYFICINGIIIPLVDFV